MLLNNSLFASRIFLVNSRSNIFSKTILFHRLNKLTPILNNNFHLKSNAVRRRREEDDAWRTGLLLEKKCISNNLIQNNLQKFIHIQSQSAQKIENNKSVNNNNKKDDDDDHKKKLEVELDDDKQLGLIARFKKMAKEYWYVLIPVHCFTSCFWFGGFYYASICGVDIVGMMESWNFSETLINPLRDSHLGHIAVAYLLYKIATPARYTVTLGGSTFAIKFLSKRGYIKPIPSKDKLVQMYKDKKDDIQQKVSDKKTEFTDKFRKNE